MYTPTAVFTNQPKAEAPAGPSLLIDDVGQSAVIAFSLRKLRSAYSGDAIEVRRASDNATQDIGFSGEDLDTSALATFCAGTKGYVRTWYDQSGNGNDVVQTTSGLQALIYDSGNGGQITNSNGNNACRTTEVGDTSATGDYVYVSPTFAAQSNPTICMVSEIIAYNHNGLMSAEANNGFAIGTYYNNQADNSKIKVVQSSGAPVAQLGTIAVGDSFCFYTYMCDECGINLSRCLGSSDVGLGNGGTLASNEVLYTATGFNASTYDNFQLFYCCAAPLYQNMYFSEYVLWDLSNNEMSSGERTTYFNNINTYYSFQF